jgi:hypothetical protein
MEGEFALLGMTGNTIAEMGASSGHSATPPILNIFWPYHLK